MPIFTRPEGTMTKLEGPPLKGEFIALVEMLEKPSVYAAETKFFPVVSQLTHYRFSHE